MTARLLSKQGPVEETEQAWRALIQCNPDNTSYYYGFFSSKDIELGEFFLIFQHILFISQSSRSFTGAVTDADRPIVLRLLQDLSMQYPRTSTPKRLELMVTSG
jgi:hypothetical protein